MSGRTALRNGGAIPFIRAAVAGLALGVSLMTVQAYSGSGNIEPCGDEMQVRQWIDGLNARRGGTTPCVDTGATRLLHWDGRLTTGARNLAIDLAQRGMLAHVDAAGRSLAQRLRVTGYQPVAAAENLAAGQRSFAEVLDAWMSSPAHCANVMRTDITEVGIACVYRNDDPYRYFWVAQFGRSREAD